MNLGLNLALGGVCTGGAAGPVSIKSRMATGPVDFVGIGDSNQIYGGYGWDHGWQYALNVAGYPMRATGLLTIAENNFLGSSAGYLYARIGNTDSGFLAASGAPAPLEAYLSKGSGGLFPGYYAYADDSAGNANYNNGLLLSVGCPIDTAAALACDYYYGTFDSGVGKFFPSARLGGSPYTFIGTAGQVDTNTGAYGMAKATLSIGASVGRGAVQFSHNRIGTNSITAPFFTTYIRARNPARTTGFAYSTLDYRGGQSARTMAYDLQQASDATLTHFFAILRDDQGAGQKCIVICVNSGLNDRGETAASVGPAAVADGDSADAFVDNYTAIVERIRAIWALNGWDLSELFWVLMVSVPCDEPDDAELVAYRSALKTYGATLGRQCQVIDIHALITKPTILASGWYDGSPYYHLNQAGQEGVTPLILGALV